MGGPGERAVDSGETEKQWGEEQRGRKMRKRYRDVRAERYCMGERERRLNRQVEREIYQ